MTQPVSASELRARAKKLRTEASQCIRDAEQIEAAEASARRVAASREAREAKAASMCRPVWKEPRDGVWVVEGIENGRYQLRELGSSERHPVEYEVRSGRPTMAWYWHTGRHTPGVLDTAATMLAWRAWCAWRKAQAVAP